MVIGKINRKFTSGTMRGLLVFILTLLISTVSGVIETSFVKGVPRLNNSLYCDYYFTCRSEGETLQWRVGNNIFNYSGQSTTGSVFVGSVSNCNFTATLLLLMSMPMSHSFKSALILSCQSNSSIPIICSDGIASNLISIPEKEVNVGAETINNSIYFERLLSQNLVYADNSTCTNVFVCGVNNRFMNVQLGNANFLFTQFDSIGFERNEVQGTSVQQAILIDKEPYSLVVAMFIVDSEVMNVTCGFSPNILFFSSMQCPVTTTPETSDTMESESTSMGSESSTVGESSTMASEGSNILPLILGPSITFGVLLLVAVIIIIIIGFHFIKYKKRLENVKAVQQIGLTQRPTDETDSVEVPLNDNNFSGIKNPKEMKNIDYSSFFNCVQYIFLTRNKNTFNAATTILTAPNIEKTTNEQLTSIDEGVYIGMIGDHPVCLVNETKNYFVAKLENVIVKYFPKAKYLIFVGRCFGLDQEKLKLADIVISKSIRHVREHGASTKLIAPEIRSKFCFYPKAVQGLKVASNRTAKHFVAKVASGVNILSNDDIRSFAFRISDIYGCEETSGELVRLFKTGIKMKDNTTKQMQVISIGAVTGYADKETVNECYEWQFMASQAAFHYVASKMINPHLPGKILYDVKMPKSKGKNTNEFAKRVKYIIITIGPDEFDAVTSYISAPNLEDIIEIIKGVYIGKIGSHSVGLLYLQNCKHYYRDMKNATVKYFPNSEYLIHVGGCSGIDPNKTKLGDVLISKEIYNINYDGSSYNHDTIEMTPEIQKIFCNSSNVEGLQLPGNRTAEHFEVRIATGTGADIEKDEHMKTIAIETRGNYGYDEVGGDIFLLQNKMTTIGRKIHFILINGVCCYKNSSDYDEWDFIASQAAIHYVASKM